MLQMLNFFNYDSLVELTVIDNLGKGAAAASGRFKITYSFLSVLKNSRVCISTRIDSTSAIETITDLFDNAN